MTPSDPGDTWATPGSRHLALSDASRAPDMACWRCNQRAFILHHAIAPAPTLLECSCCGELLNIGLLHYIYPDNIHPDALMERERCARIADDAARVAGSIDTAGVVALSVSTKIRTGK